MINQNNFMQELQQFAQNVQGDPRQQVQNLLNSGQMSQQTYNQYQQIAQAFQNNPMQALAMLFRR